jgi:hypothetical protein
MQPASDTAAIITNAVRAIGFSHPVFRIFSISVSFSGAQRRRCLDDGPRDM